MPPQPLSSTSWSASSAHSFILYQYVRSMSVRLCVTFSVRRHLAACVRDAYYTYPFSYLSPSLGSNPALAALSSCVPTCRATSLLSYPDRLGDYP